MRPRVWTTGLCAVIGAVIWGLTYVGRIGPHRPFDWAGFAGFVAAGALIVGIIGLVLGAIVEALQRRRRD